MDYEPAYTEDDVRMIVDEVLKLVERNTLEFDRRQFKDHPDVQFNNQMGIWLNDFRTGTSSESGESRELPTEAEELLDEMGDEEIVRALNREQALSTSSSGRPSKVDEWEERIRNGEVELEDIDVGTVSDGADMTRKTFYKLRDRVEGSGED